MISFSNLYEAVVQQPTPPQQPVQNTGTQIPQTQPMQPQMQQGQPVQQPQQEQKPTSVFGKIKAGYDKINAKYEAGKEVGANLLPVAASLAVPIGLYGASFVPNAAIASTMRTVGMGAMMARPILGAARQARMAAQQNR